MIKEFVLKNLITIIFIVFFVMGFIKGFKQGFLKKILSFGSLIVTIILTKVFTPTVAEMLKDFTNIEATLSDVIYDMFINTNAYDKLNLEGIQKVFNTGDLGVTIKNGLCVNIANAIINLISGIALFIVILVIIKIILKILDIVDFIPVVGQLNKILGGILGVFEVVVIIWIVFTVFRVLENVPQVSIAMESIKKSTLASVLYENNIVYNFFSNLFSIFKK